MESKSNFFSTNSELFRYLEKKRQNHQAVQTLEIVATILTISFFILFAIYPAISTISNLVTEIKTKESLSQKLRQKINQVVLAQDSFVKVQERYGIVDSAFPDHPRYSHIAAQFQGIGRQVDIDTEKLTFGLSNSTTKGQVKDKNDNVSDVSINIRDKTTYSTASEFINLLKSNRRLINISSLTFSKKEDNNEVPDASNVIEFNLSSKILYWSKTP